MGPVTSGNEGVVLRVEDLDCLLARTTHRTPRRVLLTSSTAEQCVELLAQLYVALNTLSNIRGSGDVFFNDLIHQLARYDYRIALEAELESELEPSRGATG